VLQTVGASSPPRQWLAVSTALTLIGLRFTVAQPLRIEQGQFVALLAHAPIDYFGPVLFTQRQFSAAQAFGVLTSWRCGF
jgi:hypothetical protein